MNKLKDLWNKWPIGTHFILALHFPMIKVGHNKVVYYNYEGNVSSPHNFETSNDYYDNFPIQAYHWEEAAPLIKWCDCNYYNRLLGLPEKDCE